jgi:hypothetical protein
MNKSSSTRIAALAGALVLSLAACRGGDIGGRPALA